MQNCKPQRIYFNLFNFKIKHFQTTNVKHFEKDKLSKIKEKCGRILSKHVILIESFDNRQKKN